MQMRKKFRVRVYHPDDKVAKFELKRKSFGRELKESIEAKISDIYCSLYVAAIQIWTGFRKS